MCEPDSELVVAARPLAAAKDAALSLALAVVDASPGPLLLLDDNLVIVGASSSFREAFGQDLADVRGTELQRLGDGEWASSRLKSMLVATHFDPPEEANLEMDLDRPGHRLQRLLIHAERLNYLDLDNVRIMVAVTDVTQSYIDQEARTEAEEHNLVRLKETRHRVANSLQIVASLLLQDARKSNSEETKARLGDAHRRVMSVAALERRLAEDGVGGVELRTYLASVCDNIATSLVGDREQIAFVVAGAGGVVEARMALSLGLIVTELVINALKHAFPGGRHGTITVECNFQGPNWTLVVSDDGVGVPTDRRDARVGLGTSIVQALGRELGAAIEVGSAAPGTRVAVTRTAIALVDDGRRLENNQIAVGHSV